MNSNSIFYFFNKLSKNIIYFIMLFFFINIETSLGFFSIFHNSSPSLISIVIYLCLRKFSVNPSNFILFTLGILYDVLLGSNIGSSSMFFLLIKYFTQFLNLKLIQKNSQDDWIYFTCVFISSFLITYLLNIIINSAVPDFSPVLFHVGITLIIFPFIIMSINSIYFITKLIKN